MDTEPHGPRVRPVEAFPVEQDGESLFCLHDPEGFAERPLVLPLPWFFLITKMDGTRGTAELQDAFAQQFQGLHLPEERIHELLELLDEHGFLDNDRSAQRIREVREAFLASETRPAWHAGAAYPDHAADLTHWLDGLFAGDAAQEEIGPAPQAGALQGILVPHMDLRVAAPVYVPAYRMLREAEPANLYVILGVAHHGGDAYFIATAKDFETPLGRVATDREALRLWEEEAGGSLCGGELAHRVEHSIEFQLPFLQYVNQRPFKILPVLCGSLEPLLHAGKHPGQIPELARRLEGLAAALGRAGKRVQFILSVDLSHVGPKFGDVDAVNDARAAEVRNRDAELLACAERVDAAAWFEHFRADGNARRVDAGAAVHTFLWLLRRGRGVRLGYDQDRQPETESMVSYASMAFLEEAPLESAHGAGEE